MFKYKFHIIQLKKIIPSLILILFIIGLMLFSNTNLMAAKKGLTLWANSIVPSLFPFFVATELLSKTNFVYFIGKFFNNIMYPFFNIPGEGSFALIMGLLSGYPVGAKIATNFRKNNVCSKEECERLLSFTNNSGPLFIIGSVGISMFGSSAIGFLLLISHILASITVGFIFKFWKYNKKSKTSSNTYNSKHSNTLNISNLGEVLGNCITSSINTILMIGGFVVIFSVILSILNSSNILYILCNLIKPIFDLLHIPQTFSAGFISGIIEITNGLNIISSIPEKQLSINILLSSFILSLGGISVFLQVWSIVAKSDLSIKPYIYGKILQAIFSTIYTFILMNSFSIFNFNL